MLLSARTAGRARCRRHWARSRRHSARSRRRGFDLRERALAWRFVRSPAQKTGAVAEPSAADVIVTDLDHQFGTQELPLSGAFDAPPAGPPRRVASKPRRHDHAFELPCQRLTVELAQCRSKPDMIE